MKPISNLKKNVFTAFALTIIVMAVASTNAYGQIHEVPEEEPIDKFIPITVVYTKPVFPGCEDASDAMACLREKIDEHIRSNFKYPKEAQDAGIEGRVYVNFIINAQGSIRILDVLGPSEILKRDAKRMIELLPVMTPGKDKSGNPVNVTYAYPIIYKLN